MSDVVRTTKVGPVTINIVPDKFGEPECPLESYCEEDGIRFITFERHSTLNSPKYHNFDLPEDAVKWAKDNRYEIFPLYKYEHGQVAYSINHVYPFTDRWDAGQAGFVMVKKSVYRGSERRHKIAESLCSAITKWCNNDYYGYEIVDKDDNVLDSCWGFDDIDYCEIEAKAVAKHLAEIKETENV